MRRLAALVIVLAARIAAASPTPMITAPAGWHADPERGSALAAKVSAVQHFGGATASVAVEAYAPAAGTIALVVTRVTAEHLPGTREEAVRAELGALTGTVDEAAKQVRATRAQTESGVKLAAVTLLAADGDHLVAVTGECLDGSSDPSLGAACAAALRTLDPGIPAARRIAIGIATADAPAAEPREPVRDDTHAQFRDGTHVQLTPMTIAHDTPAADRRPIYIGAGLIVMAAVFYWNRRRRDRFDREDAPQAGGDDDRDDLHAAARGDAKDEDV